jgi:hypothetical protein
MLGAVNDINADWFYQTINYTCDSNEDKIVIEFKGAYNENGKSLISNKGPDGWDPWELVIIGKDGKTIIKELTVIRKCKLSDGEYLVEIGPNPANNNTSGLDGLVMTAWVAVTKNNHIITKKYMGSWKVEGPVMTKVVIRGKSNKPKIYYTSSDDFYK